MTREEFNRILSEEIEKEIARVCSNFNSANNMNRGELIARIMTSSITSSTNIILSALEKSGVLKYDD